MRGGFTSVPLPAYWSSKDPEQWRRYPVKPLACTNARCAANNANYAMKIVSERPAKRPRRPYQTSTRSRSVSATSYTSTPVESQRNSKLESVDRCNDCNAPLVRLAQPASSSASLTPPTPLQVRTVAHGSYVARVNRSHCVASCVPLPIIESPPYFHKRSSVKKLSLSAPPPSECEDYGSEEPELSAGKAVTLGIEVGGEVMDEARTVSSSPDAVTAGASKSRTPASLSPTEPETPSHTGDNHHELDDILPKSTSLSFNESLTKAEETVAEDNIQVPTEIQGNFCSFNYSDYGGSESIATPVPSEKGMDLSKDIRHVFERNRISSFYNVLYSPDGNALEEHETGLNKGRAHAEHDLTFKIALEIAILSAFITILVLACFPYFLSGVRYHVLGCCSCTCHAAASASASNPSSSIGQFKWFERWVYRGTHNLLGCRSPKPTLGSTVLR